MPRVQWPLRHGRPCVEVILVVAATGQPFSRMLLADTGAGSRSAAFQLILDEPDCLVCGGKLLPPIALGGAYTGSFPLYDLLVRLPALGIDQTLAVVAVPSVPAGFDGIACFSFLNGFTYGNFGDRGQFGLEC
jgi:hypothetical protein